MEAVKAELNKTPRSLSKQARRKQLIEATIKCIADKGLSGTTMADVTPVSYTHLTLPTTPYV